MAARPAARADRCSTSILVDCLTLWVANLMLRGDDDAAILQDADDAGRAAPRRAVRRAHVIVSNEVGEGVHPADRARAAASATCWAP